MGLTVDVFTRLCAASSMKSSAGQKLPAPVVYLLLRGVEHQRDKDILREASCAGWESTEMPDLWVSSPEACRLCGDASGQLNIQNPFNGPSTTSSSGMNHDLLFGGETD